MIEIFVAAGVGVLFALAIDSRRARRLVSQVEVLENQLHTLQVLNEKHIDVHEYLEAQLRGVGRVLAHDEKVMEEQSRLLVGLRSGLDPVQLETYLVLSKDTEVGSWAGHAEAAALL